MTPYEIVITEPAESDLNNIIDYISVDLQNPLAAKKLLSKIVRQINDLQSLPKRFPLVMDNILANQGIRKITVDNYIVFYNVSDTNKCVTIIRILYGKRNWKDVL